MPRRLRSYLPGTPFHITARTIGRYPWFDASIRDFILTVIDTALERSDAVLHAYVIMHNHLHLILRQGNFPLAHVMQPMLLRIALAVQRCEGWQGHVFEKRYYERACADPGYLRDAIVYTHLNPVRAGLCEDPVEYKWSSHRWYSGQLTAEHPLGISRLVATPAIFANQPDCSPATVHSDYSNYVRIRRERDLLAAADASSAWPVLPNSSEGDRYWALHFDRVNATQQPDRRERRDRPDLRDLVRQVLSECEPELTLELLRSTRGGKRMVAVRREIVSRAKRVGHRGVDIARFVNISESAVSRIASLKWAHAEVQASSPIAGAAESKEVKAGPPTSFPQRPTPTMAP
jgi:REP-associated tyrosine transposase